MIRRLLPFFFIGCVFSLFSAAVHGEEQPQVFTNQDIQKYQIPSDAKAKPAKGGVREDAAERRRQATQQVREEQEMEYWCEKASAYKKKIEKADAAVTEIEQDIAEKDSAHIRSSKKSSSLEKSLEKARKRLKDAEDDLADLEQEAHRKGAKPGWLRCQR